MNSVKSDLIAAATVMRERGKCEGMFEDENGAVCMYGALNVARTGAARNPRGYERSDPALDAWVAIYTDVPVDELSDSIPAEACEALFCEAAEGAL